ncbi:MAG: hypothetical protein ACRDRR_05710 [Pseudonocardiaceae bacterium]
MSQKQSQRSSPVVALFVARTRRFRLWRTVSGLSIIGGLLLASVVVGERWLGLLGIVIYALGSVLVVRDMTRHVSEAQRPDRQDRAGNHRQAIRPPRVVLARHRTDRRWFDHRRHSMSLEPATS